jgi:LuxR family maltose regulon positive regulatory protein
MTPSLAKISRPRLPETYPRERLFRLLDHAAQRPAVWVAAPPGAGKTTLVAGWLDVRGLPSLWYQVDEADNDIATFFYYTGLAANTAVPGRHKPLPLFTAEYLHGIPAFTRRYFEQLFSRLKPPCVLVFDDYQAAGDDSPLHAVACEGVRAAPPGISLVFISRGMPPAAMAPLRAGRRLTVLGWDDIRLTADETSGIAALHAGERVGPQSFPLIHETAQGWAAGVILVTESLSFRGDGFVPPGQDDLAEVFDYFAAEILAKTTPDVREFLLKTSLLPKMTAATAQRLTGRERSEQLLSHLVRNHYFTQRHVHSEPVFQYHPLFRDYLLAQLRSTYPEAELSGLLHMAAHILADAGEVEHAAELLRSAGDWREFVPLVLSQARSLMTQGRIRTLTDWLGSIPAESADNDPWILYWQGACRLPFAPAESRGFFERAFHLFASGNDQTGTFLAWSGLLDSVHFLYEGNDFTLLDRWIDWFIARMHGDASFPSPEIELIAVAGITGALLLRRPDHPEIHYWMKRGLACFHEHVHAGLDLRMRVIMEPAWYYVFCGDLANLAKCTALMEEAEKQAEKAAVSPFVRLQHKIIAATTLLAFPATAGQALEVIRDGRELSERAGIHTFDHMFFSQGVYASFGLQDLEQADEFLRKLEKAVEGAGQNIRGHYYYLSGWRHLLRRDAVKAAAYAEMAVNLVVMTGTLFPEMLCRLLLAEAMTATGETGRAEAELERVAADSLRTGNRFLEYFSQLARAHIHLDKGNAEDALVLLKNAFARGRTQGYDTMLFWWRPAKLARLCAAALEAGIEEEYARSLVRELKLVPEESPVTLGNWPWPVKIYTLGRFEVLKEGRPLEFPAKAPRKIILLLKLLVSCGRNGANEEYLADLLWPDAEGDAALQSLATGIHRLRRLLGSDRAIERRNGRMKLAAGYCGVDAHAFEELCERAEDAMSADAQARLMEKARLLYRGEFLVESGEPWALAYRERLRERYAKQLRGERSHPGL